MSTNIIYDYLLVRHPMVQNLGIIKIQKLDHKKQTNLNTKICDTCGQTFETTLDEKNLNCLICYQTAKTIDKPKLIKRNGTQAFTQIVCVKCKLTSYLDFIPSDINAAYCNACFSKMKQLSQKSKTHAKNR